MRHLTALPGGSRSRQRLGEARSGVGRLGTVVGTLPTRSPNQREGAARSSNLATASARPLVTLTTDPCRLATYGRGNRVAGFVLLRSRRFVGPPVRVLVVQYSFEVVLKNSFLYFA